jgi:hypothetical protein
VRRRRCPERQTALTLLNSTPTPNSVSIPLPFCIRKCIFGHSSLVVSVLSRRCILRNIAAGLRNALMLYFNYSAYMYFLLRSVCSCGRGRCHPRSISFVHALSKHVVRKMEMYIGHRHAGTGSGGSHPMVDFIHSATTG